jgi:uncharacterized membrane protein
MAAEREAFVKSSAHSSAHSSAQSSAQPPPSPPPSPPASPLAQVLRVVFVLVAPVVLYVAVTRFSAVTAALIVAGWIAVRTVPTIVVTATREQLLAALRLPAIAIVFSILGAVANDKRLLLLLPSATQLGFAWVFGSSLRGKVPLVEQFARMQKPNLGTDEVRYCRTVTWIWAFYLATAAVVGLVLAFVASPVVWAAYTGAGAYVLVAVLFGAEYVYRNIRFRSADGTAVQRALYRFLPPRR